MTLIASIATALVVAALAGALVRRPESKIGRRATRSGHEKFGVDVTPGQFLMTTLGAAMATFTMVLALTGLIVTALVPALVVGFFPRAFYARRRAQRVAVVQEAWPDGLRDLVSSVRSGSSLPAALEDLGRFGPAPLREVFAGFAVYARSLGVESALEMIRADLADPTSDRVIEVLILAHERGGSVVPEILDDLASATTKDVWTLEGVRSEALEQKINSRVVFVLPWIVLVVMTMRSGAFREFYATGAGVAVVIVGGCLSLFGMAVASRIGRQPAEPRVFGGGSQ